MATSTQPVTLINYIIYNFADIFFGCYKSRYKFNRACSVYNYYKKMIRKVPEKPI